MIVCGYGFSAFIIGRNGAKTTTFNDQEINPMISPEFHFLRDAAVEPNQHIARPEITTKGA